MNPLRRPGSPAGLRPRPALLLASVAAVGGVAGCGPHSAESPPAFSAPLALPGGQSIPAAVLTEGAAVYTQYCRSCHGVRGDGHGHAAPGLRPAPRDFTTGVFKFARVASGELPTDADLERTIRQGLGGTAMQAWDVPRAQLQPLIGYLKTFSPRWKDEPAGDPLSLDADPWTGKTADARSRGERLYHALAQCSSCHAAYASRDEIMQWTRELLPGAAPTAFRPDMFAPAPKESETFHARILPPDFLWSPLRAGESTGDIAHTLAAGIGGTAMPRWKDALPDADVWAVAHYVRSLLDLRGTPGAEALRHRIGADAP